MSSGLISSDRPILRRDLVGLVRHGRRRAYRIVVDDVSGRFVRVSEQGWQSLQSGDADQSLWRQADAAGWTRNRSETSGPPLNPLYVRIPIVSVDLIAKTLAPLTGWLFAPLAVLFWTVLIAVAAVLAISHRGQIIVSLGSLQQFFAQSDPLWLGLIFVATKLAHELGHAIVCRRVGSRCGQVGVWLLCGMPCPYCDVTDVWRQASTVKRAAVMMAGIYVELVLAALATFTWLVATDPAIRLHALNLMVVCGISTLVFNANPLMRYDGYYVLGDLVGSVNLRQEASDAFRSVIVRPLAGPGYALSVQRSVRSLSLALYHASSKLYRVVVMLAICAFLLSVAEIFHVRQLAAISLVLAVIVLAGRSFRRFGGIIGGAGGWSAVPWQRRIGVGLALLILAGFVLLLPLPRYRTVDGWVDVADATQVYLANEGMIESVGFDFGDAVAAGDSLVQVSSDTLGQQNVKLEGKLRLASLRRDLSRRLTLDHSDTTGHWNTLKAAEQAVSNQLASVRKRLESCDVRAPISGVVLPADPTIDAHDHLSFFVAATFGNVGPRQPVVVSHQSGRCSAGCLDAGCTGPYQYYRRRSGAYLGGVRIW